MKKLILLILTASLLTSCGAKPSGTPDDIPGTDDTSSTEMTETVETEPETTTEPATTVGETTEEVTETTIPETTAGETTAEPVFDPDNLMGGTLLCPGDDSNLVQYDDHISIIDADGEHKIDLPMQEYIWTYKNWNGFLLLTKSRIMYNVYVNNDGIAVYKESDIEETGKFHDYTYYNFSRYTGKPVLLNKSDEVVLTSFYGFSVVNGWLIDGDVYYHWRSAYSENLTKVTPDECFNRISPLDDGRIIVGETTSFKVCKQPDGEIESEHGGYDRIWSVANDKVFVQKDGHILLVNKDGMTAVDFGEFSPGDGANVVGYQSGWGSDAMYVQSDETDENGNSVSDKITFDGEYYYVTFDNVRTPEMPPDQYGIGVEFYYIPVTGESGRIDNVVIGAIEKPVLYLYPIAPTEVTVTFAHPELLTTVYPEYRDGWRMFVQNDGTMTEIGKTREYYALYWEERPTEPYEFTEGFYVDKNYPEFLEEKLSELGLTDREANEFIMYWLPVLEKNGRNLVAFETTESREYANKLQITPKPDSLLRISIHIKKVDSDPGLPEQKLPCFLRKGFTAVEWGGQVHT